MRALPVMLRRCRELGIDDPALQVKLFDALVHPVMMYAVEFWGAGDVLKEERAGDLVQRSFLRGVLGVRRSTPNVTVLAEAGRYPLRVFAAKMLLNFPTEDLEGAGAACQSSLQWLLRPLLHPSPPGLRSTVRGFSPALQWSFYADQFLKRYRALQLVAGVTDLKAVGFGGHSGRRRSEDLCLA